MKYVLESPYVRGKSDFIDGLCHSIIVHGTVIYKRICKVKGDRPALHTLFSNSSFQEVVYSCFTLNITTKKRT